MSDLVCHEQVITKRDLKAPLDESTLQDERLLKNLMDLEKFYVIKENYLYNGTQPEVKPHMRDILSNWMLDVCTAEKCEPDVFPLAMSLLDRFMCRYKVKVECLQLYGAVCILIASKAKDTCPMQAEILVSYAAHSYLHSVVISAERTVVVSLDYDVHSVTPIDFVDPFLYKLQNLATNFLHDPKAFVDRVRKLVFVYINASYLFTEEFMHYEPSLLTFTCVCCAVHSLTQSPCHNFGRDVIAKMFHTTTIDEHKLHQCFGKFKSDLLEQKVQSILRNINYEIHEVTASCVKNPQYVHVYQFGENQLAAEQRFSNRVIN